MTKKQFTILAELTIDISNWLQYYNFTRTKTKLGGKSTGKYRVLITQKVA
ncbi:IS3 family transposase [Loigolactobacillus iwatensis]|nr:IS3 family transposase [Loigolactobacillus iwatensis]